MTLQSSFLIRCLLHSAGESSRAYHAQHIQTGAEFRTNSMADLAEWMANQNSGFLAATLASGTPEEK